MTTTALIAKAIGRKKMAAALGVGETAVSNAVIRGQFPSSWFLVVAGLSRSRGLECPQELFSMKRAVAGEVPMSSWVTPAPGASATTDRPAAPRPAAGTVNPEGGA